MKPYLLVAMFLLPLLATAQQDDYYQKQPRPPKQTGQPVYTIVLRDGTELTFITENFVLFGGRSNRNIDFAGVLSGGVRFDRRRHAFDVAAYLPVVIGNSWRGPVTLVPYGSYHLRIGK